MGLDDKDRLDRIFAALEADLESASEEELREELRAEGQDPDAVDASVASLFEGVLRDFRQRPLRQAQQGYREAISRYSQAPSRVPKDPIAQRSLLTAVAAAQPRLTAQFRDLQDLSDADVESALRQLEQLGLIPEGRGEE